jgi:hypothetical protein
MLMSSSWTVRGMAGEFRYNTFAATACFPPSSRNYYRAHGDDSREQVTPPLQDTVADTVTA